MTESFSMAHLHRLEQQLEQEKQQVENARARYRAVLDSAAAGIIRINHRGIIQEINPFGLKLLGYEAQELLGENISKVMPQRWAEKHDGYLDHYVKTGQTSIIGKGREVEALTRDGRALPIHLAVSEIQSVAAGEGRQFIGIISDLRDVRAAREAEQRKRRLLQVLLQGMTDYQALISQDRLWVFLMEALRELTNSDYALIGEVLQPEGKKALKIHAITDLSWSDESRLLMEKLVAGNMLLANPDTLIGRVFTKGERVLDNRMACASRQNHLPPGHPELHRYLGVPIIDQGEVIGMYAIANAAEDYPESLVDWLKPFTATCALLIRLYRQMQEREAINQQLLQARDEAEQASKAKGDFLSAMSHELRTPMNAILGFAQLLQSGKQPLTDRQQRHVQQIYKSGQHLLTLINDVLDLAKIEAGKISVSLEPIDINEVLQDALNSLQPIADQQGITMILQPTPVTTSWVLADFTRCKQVLINLITNAIKYNSEQGKVIISCELQEQYLRINIQDTGRGLSKEQQEQLFQPFNRIGAENSSIEGTGVGLALTRKLLEAMQGQIGVESQPGQGSCFWFTLPRTRRMNVNAPILPREPAEQHQKKILYVEDNPASQRLLQAFFNERSGYHLELAASAEIALELAASSNPDLILMDLDLPGMSGMQAIKMLARNPLTASIPVIAISASGSDRCKKAIKEAGFAHFLDKPLDLEQLQVLLRATLEVPS